MLYRVSLFFFWGSLVPLIPLVPLVLLEIFLFFSIQISSIFNIFQFAFSIRTSNEPNCDILLLNYTYKIILAYLIAILKPWYFMVLYSIYFKFNFIWAGMIPEILLEIWYMWLGKWIPIRSDVDILDFKDEAVLFIETKWILFWGDLRRKG